MFRATAGIQVLLFLGLLSTGCSGSGGGKRNHSPTADAGEDLTVNTGEIAGLAGSGLDDDPEDLLQYEWSFFSLPAGSGAVLLNEETTTPSFITDVEGDYILQLLVSDGAAISADQVLVSAVGQIPTNLPPAPDAGEDLTAPVHGQFSPDPGFALLDATGSTDPEGDYLFYLWTISTLPAGSVAFLNDPAIAQPTLIVDREGEYGVSLWVSDDGSTWTGPDIVRIDAAGASLATLAAGDAQMAVVGGDLPVAITIAVTNEFQDPIRGVAVSFEITTGPPGDAITPLTAYTDALGVASATWTLDTLPGGREANATVAVWVDELGGITALPPVPLSATGQPGPAVAFDLSAGVLQTTVDTGTSVQVVGYDAFGNQAANDDATVVSLSASGAASFAAVADAGTINSGAGASQVEATVEGGVLSLGVESTLAETVTVTLDAGADTVSIEFAHGATTRVVLFDPDDAVAGGAPMQIEAEAVDQYGNLATGDATSRFSIAIVSTGASFGAATEGVLLASSGTKAWFRVAGGRAGIQVTDPVPELVELSLGDPAPGSLLADDVRDARFTGPPDAIALIAGDAQDGTAGMPLPSPLLFEVRDAAGFTVAGATVLFTITTNGSGAISPDPAISDRDGRAGVTWVLGQSLGPNGGVASVGGSLDAAFSANGVAGAPAAVLLRQPTAPPPGSDLAVVRIEVLDSFGNVVTTDGSTTFSVALDGAATWSAALSGSALGLGGNVVLVAVDGGVAELEAMDPVDETVTVAHFDSTGNGLVFLKEGSAPDVAYDFDSGGFQGWTTANNNATVIWDVDALPSPVAGVANAFVSAPNSLNFNDDVDFSNGATVAGSATSPATSLSGSPVLSFSCNYQTETFGTSWDRRHVYVSNNGFASTVLAVQLSTSPGPPVGGACAGMGTWHSHSFVLDPAWGDVQVRFNFNSVDSAANGGDGWFVDDVTIAGLEVPISITYSP